MIPSRQGSFCFFAFLLSACVADVGTDSRTYRPSEVVAEADTLRGRLIRVRGYLILRTEAHGLWDSRDDHDYIQSRLPHPDDPVWTHCITAYYDERGVRAIGRNHPRDMVAVGEIGVARSDNSIDFGACNDVYITITDVLAD